MSDAHELSEETLRWLEGLSECADSGPWRAMVEGRDHSSGDSFIMVGRDDDRGEDIYVSRDTGPAMGSELDVIAAARTYLPLLIAEVRRSRALVQERDETDPPANRGQ